MKMDDLYRVYDGAVPLGKIRFCEYGGVEDYARAFAETAAHNFYKRALQTVRAIAAWRIASRYDESIREAMLVRLNGILSYYRSSSLTAWDLSRVAVTAAPVRIA